MYIEELVLAWLPPVKSKPSKIEFRFGSIDVREGPYQAPQGQQFSPGLLLWSQIRTQEVRLCESCIKSQLCISLAIHPFQSSYSADMQHSIITKRNSAEECTHASSLQQIESDVQSLAQL